MTTPKIDPLQAKLPGNSLKERATNVLQENSPDDDIKKVIKGKVVKRKKSLGASFAETFLGSDAKGVGEYVIADVLVPALKNLISEMFTTSIEMMLFGETRPRGGKRDRNKTVVSYGSFYNNRSDSKSDNRKRSSGGRLEDIVLESRGEAEEVIDAMIALLETYDGVTIADLNRLIGEESTFTDNKWGWTNLSKATVSRVRDGYLLVLPRPVELD